jgi:RNA polymerase sigma factor (sigma-70 family)
MEEQEGIRRFEDVVLPHLSAAYNLARWLTRNDHDAEDVVQEAYLRAFKFFGSFRGDQGRVWLLGIVRNTCYTWWQQNRKQMLNTPFDEESRDLEAQHGAVPENDPAALAARADDWKMLAGALEKLPVEFREVIVLRELEDLSYKEIADIAEIPIGTVMSRLSRARRMLLSQLTQLEQEARHGM